LHQYGVSKGVSRNSEVAANNNIEKRLWEAADQLRANSSLTAQEYSRPVLGLIFLKYADHRFTEAEKELKAGSPAAGALLASWTTKPKV
jgi:type I restriction-modification system DNA methylase subunit